MVYQPALLYAKPLADLGANFTASIAAGCAAHKGSKPIEVFFRADDIGVPSRLFHQLITLFRRHELPLCLAVVPSWLTRARLAGLRDSTGADDTLWCWHQHGRRHLNFESSGKKQEFGPARDKATLKDEISCGRDRLRTLLGDSFSPFFTPPWNRCSRAAVQSLHELGFRAISRSAGAQPDFSAILPDIRVNVDLHTRKETAASDSLRNLLTELEEALAGGRVGIMIHHQRMNGQAFRLLDLLLTELRHQPNLAFCRFEQLV